MANYIEHAKVFQSELDKAAVETASSGWMELNDKLVKYEGGDEVKIPTLETDGLADYDRDEGFADGDITLTYESKKFGMDRGRGFDFDEHEVTESNFIVTASNVMGEFQRVHVMPEVDAYRYSTLASLAIAASRAAGGYTPDEATVLQKLYYDIAAVQDVVGEVPLVITMASKVKAMLASSEKLRRVLDVTDFQQGDITLKVNSLDGQHPIIGVGSSRLKTKFIFRDGRSTAQKKGGFVPDADAKSINWIICPKDAPIAVSRTDKMRIFDPETYQKKRAWHTDYRKFHDLWLKKSSLPKLWVNTEEAL